MKVFSKNNFGFICVNCGRKVDPHPTSSRDHCNFCLYSLHVDINPGDRLNNCKGLLRPVGLRVSNGKTQVVYNCEKCGGRVYCVISQDDSKDELLELNKRAWV